MPIFLQIKELMKKAQELPLWQRKAILWTIVIILGIALVALWGSSTGKKLQNIDFHNTAKQLVPLETEGQN
ncbi:hypothetical protein KKC00_00615 [Patescibacteria group bacterium]|nr:hypothetical protein [Patescibacteria group bacterium]